MSSASISSSKREKDSSDLAVELESVRALNSTLRNYLEHIRMFKRNLRDMHENCKQLNKVNGEWVSALEDISNKDRFPCNPFTCAEWLSIVARER